MIRRPSCIESLGSRTPEPSGELGDGSRGTSTRTHQGSASKMDKSISASELFLFGRENNSVVSEAQCRIWITIGINQKLYFFNYKNI
jgi:hypothetical protein